MVRYPPILSASYNAIYLTRRFVRKLSVFRGQVGNIIVHLTLQIQIQLIELLQDGRPAGKKVTSARICGRPRDLS